MAQVHEAKKQLGSNIPWLVDDMTNGVKHAFGSRNNSEFVIGPDGVFLHTRAWSDYEKLRGELAALLGEVNPPSTVEELGLQRVPVPRRPSTAGLINPAPLPRGSKPLKLIPSKSGQPYYAKLRAEASPALLTGGRGKLHLGFYLDPLYQVHWNNSAGPIQFEISGSDKETFSPKHGKGPTPDVVSDHEPREFVVDVAHLKANASIHIKVAYYVCDDGAQWCKLIEQTYEIHATHDRDAGLMRRRTVDGDWRG